jgi:magnesium transporter
MEVLMAFLNDIQEKTVSELESLIESRDFNTLREQTRNWSPPEIADLMEPLPVEKQAIVFRLLPREQAAKVFTYLSEERQEELLKAMASEDVANILNAMPPDERTSLLEEMPANVIQQMLNLLSPDERVVAAQLLGYEEDSVGRLMTPDFVRLRRNWTVSQALEHIRRYGVDSETMSVLYVVDQGGKLTDELRIRQILLSAPETPISELMNS